MTTNPPQEKPIEVKLKRLQLGTLTVNIKGKTPLLMDKFPEEAKQAILEKQSGVSKTNKKLRNPKTEIDLAIHKTSTGAVGFPVYGFKKGLMEVTSFVGDKFFSKKLVAGSVKIINGVDGLIPINFKKQSVVQHSIGSNTKFTPCFHDWSCTLVIQFEKNNISAQDIVTLLNYSGFYIGIGAWRPKSGGGGSGEYGMYEVVAK